MLKNVTICSFTAAQTPVSVETCLSQPLWGFFVYFPAVPNGVLDNYLGLSLNENVNSTDCGFGLLVVACFWVFFTNLIGKSKC